MTTELEPYDHSVNATLRPLPGRVLVTDMEHGATVLASGLIIPDDNGRERGIRPRWATVWAVGSAVTDVTPGDQILVSHGRWSRGVKIRDGETHLVVRMIEPESILLVADR